MSAPSSQQAALALLLALTWPPPGETPVVAQLHQGDLLLFLLFLLFFLLLHLLLLLLLILLLLLLLLVSLLLCSSCS